MVLAVSLALFVFVVGPTVFMLDRMPDLGRLVLPGTSPRRRHGQRPSGGDADVRPVAVGLGGLLLGLVGSRGRRSSACSSPGSRAVATIRQLRHRRAAGAEPGQPDLVRGLRRRGHRRSPARRRRPRRQGRARRASCSACSTSCRGGRPSVSDAVVVMLLVAIFFVSGADAASIVMGTLSERGTLDPSKWVVGALGCRDRWRRGGDAARGRRGRVDRSAEHHRSSRRCGVRDQ